MGVGLMDIEMHLSLSYYGIAPGKTNPEHFTDTLKGCYFRGISTSGEHGPSPILVEMLLDVMNIFFNGRDLKGNRA